jgi:large subunit ribosomal protein L24
MEKSFVSTWKASTQPRRQRKYRYNAPLHILSKFTSVNLAKDLRSKYATRNIEVRKGDKIKVMRGQYKGKTGKVESVSIKDSKVYVAGVETIRKDGTKNLIALEPSKLQIVELDLTDKRRLPSKSSAKKD